MFSKIALYFTLVVLTLTALLQIIGCNFTSPKIQSKVDVTNNAPLKTKGPNNSTFLKRQPPLKTLPVGSVQELVVPEDSPYAKIYKDALINPDINSNAVNNAFEFFLKHKEQLIRKDLCLSKDNLKNTKNIRNQDCIIVADYTKTKLQKRLHIFKLKEEKIYSFYTAHGKGSNEKEDSLRAARFSNSPGSLQTSLGFYLTGASYTSQKDTFGPGPNNGIKLDGLSCTNNNARRRYVVLHTAKYVTEHIEDKDSIGYSEGCITFPPSQQALMLSCMNGALLYNYAEK